MCDFYGKTLHYQDFWHHRGCNMGQHPNYILDDLGDNDGHVLHLLANYSCGPAPPLPSGLRLHDTYVYGYEHRYEPGVPKPERLRNVHDAEVLAISQAYLSIVFERSSRRSVSSDQPQCHDTRFGDGEAEM
jgi:hypothetical protein